MEITIGRAGLAAAEDLDAIAALMVDAFGEGEDWLPRLRWQYLENPQGLAVCVNAWDEAGALVAHYAVIPTAPFADPRFQGIRTYLSLNTAVHPRVQGKGLFKKTAKAVYGHLEALGPHAVLGVANENSIHGFISSLGFHLLGQLRLEAHAPAMAPFAQAPRLLAMDPEQVRWRLGRPGGGYRRRQADQVYCVKPFKGLPVRCFLTAGGLAGPGLADLPESSPWDAVGPAIYATYGFGTRFAWLVPESLRPSPFHLICRPGFAEPALPLLNHIQSTRFELIDFDVV